MTSRADSGKETLRAAILAANANPGPDDIEFGSGMRGTNLLLTSGPLTITDDLTILGPGADALAVSGGGKFRVFEIGKELTVSLLGLTISRGSTAGDGGGILARVDTTLRLDQVALTDNSARGGSGGAIDSAGTLAVKGCTFTRNVARERGGAIDSRGGTLTASGSSFSENQAYGGASLNGAGGAIFVEDSPAVTVNASMFIDNLAVGDVAANGGAIAGRFVKGMSVADSTFANNQSIGGDWYGTGFSEGGGIWAVASNLTVSNSAFVNNLARGGNGADRSHYGAGDAAGGAIFVLAYHQFPPMSVTVRDSAFLDNRAEGGDSAAGAGGAATGGAIVSAGGTALTVTGSKFFGNAAVGGTGGPQYAGGTAVGGGILNASGSHLMVSGSSFVGNVAQGGPGSRGATGASGLGGAIANGLPENGGFGDLPLVIGAGVSSSLVLMDSHLFDNRAEGGSADAGGTGAGGGVWAGPGTANMVLRTEVGENRAAGGAGRKDADGSGEGGGLFIDLGASAMADLFTWQHLHRNDASTSDDDVCGVMWPGR